MSLRWRILVAWAVVSAAPLLGRTPAPGVVHIPRVERAPLLEEFLEMRPAPAWDGKLAKVEEFVQRSPKDGAPPTFRTAVYLGYDDKKLYVIFICFDAQPAQIRARMARREQIGDDDEVRVMLDSFYDRRRAYVFSTNPLGIQRDMLYAEGFGHDSSFDTLWESAGKITAQGYVAWMAIPFRSLRFARSGHTWGMVLYRSVPRLNEDVYWPHVSSRVEGLLNQGGTLNGLERISPGRNIQLIPYGALRTFRALDTRDPAAPRFESKRAEFDGGLDAKVVLKDRLVLDFTVNPDFSQVESDSPQITANQRFEVFFPEKRPFFQENASYFDTPITLLFTRRIADPRFGVRATGKLGRYALGLLFADDEAPGKRVPAGDPLEGKRAWFGVARVNRDIGKNNTLGMIYTERRFENAFNRVGGADFSFKFGKNWKANGQAVTSATRFTDGATQAGPAYSAYVQRAGRQLFLDSYYEDNSGGFHTATGFFRRPDVRRFSNFIRWRFRPEGKRLISHGPAAFQFALWAHDGTRLEERVNVNYFFEFARQTEIGAFVNSGHERLRPADFSALASNRDYVRNNRGVFFYTSYFKQFSMWGEFGGGRSINFGPAAGPPVPVHSSFFSTGFTVRPLTRLTVDNIFFHSRLRELHTKNGVFNNHIFRSKWNYQLSRELSVRFITQYEALLANGTRSALSTTKNLNFDFLVTWLLHPGTALYIGYNSNLQNLDPALTLAPSGEIRRTRDRFTNDGRQFFVKFSYLFRF